MLPVDIPYLTLGFFIGALVLSLCLGVFMQRLNMSTIQVLFSILSLYLVIHFSNSISSGDSKKNSSPFQTAVSSLQKTVFSSNASIASALYLIIWAVLTTLYFVDLNNTDQKVNSVTMGIISFLALGALMIFGAIHNSAINKKEWMTEGTWIGLFISLVGLLVMTYYLLSTTYDSHLSFSIVCFILMFVGTTILLMLYNLKNIANFLLFLSILLLPIWFIYLFKATTWETQVGGVFVLLAWIGINLIFWSTTKLTFEMVLNMNSLTIMISCVLGYLVFYYTYLTFTSKKTVSQKFSQIVLIIMFAYLFLQIFKKSKMATNPFVAFAINVLEYIPCMYDNLVSRILGMKREPLNEDFSYHSGGTMIISGIVLFIAAYYLYPTLRKWLISSTNPSGVTLVGDAPLSVNETHLIRTYEELATDPKKQLYNYGIAFDLYIDPSSGNDTFYNVINFSGNLFVTYNTDKNQLYIYALKEEGGEDPPQVALYRYNQFPLQKWTNIEINYVGGVYDVFVDKKIKTSHRVVAHHSYENIYVGEAGSSVVGKVKNFMYYDKPIPFYDNQKSITIHPMSKNGIQGTR
jgi:hypothetical protein